MWVGQLLRVFGQPRELLDRAGGRAGVERTEPLTTGERRDELRDEDRVGRRPVDVVGEVGGDLEELEELMVVRAEQVVEPAVSDERDLDVEGDRLGLEGRGRQQAQRLTERLDADLARSQRSFQFLPGIRLQQDLVRFENEVPAVRPVERSGADEGEVRHKGPELGDVLGPTDEIRVGRVILDDDRGAVVRAVPDEDVHAVASERTAIGGRWAHGLRSRVRLGGQGEELRSALDHIPFDVVEVAHHRRQGGEAVAQLVDEMTDRGSDDFAVEVAQPAPHLPLPVRDLAKDLLEVALEGRDLRPDPLLVRLGQVVEVIGRQDLAVPGRCQADAERGPDERDPGGVSAPFDVREARFAVRLELRFDRLLAAAILVALEGRRDRALQLETELRHRLPKYDARRRRQPQRAGALRVGEVVDVAPVVGSRLAGRARGQELPQGGRLADPRWAEGEDVEPDAGRGDRQFDRLDGPLLADDRGDLRARRGRGERHRGDRTAAVEPARRQRSQGHRRLLRGLDGRTSFCSRLARGSIPRLSSLDDVDIPGRAHVLEDLRPDRDADLTEVRLLE